MRSTPRKSLMAMRAFRSISRDSRSRVLARARLLIAIAGVGDQLECALRHGGDEGIDRRDVDGARCKNADRSIGRLESLFLDDAAKLCFESAKQDDLGATHFGSISGGVQAPERLERVAYGRDPRRLCRAKHGSQDRWETCACACGCRHA